MRATVVPPMRTTSILVLSGARVSSGASNPRTSTPAIKASFRFRSCLPLVSHPHGDVVLGDRRPLSGSVARRHRVERFVAAPIVILVLEEEDDERLVSLGIVEHDDLGRRDVGGPLSLLDLAVHLVHAVLSDALEGNNTR